MRSPPTNNKNESFDHSTISPSKTDQQEDMTSGPADPSLSAKRRNRWDSAAKLNERQTVAKHANLEDELRVIVQTSIPQSEPTTQSNDIPQSSKEPIVIETTEIPGKSKWDDDEDEMTTDSIQHNQIQPKP
jgi:hypothetical protein